MDNEEDVKEYRWETGYEKTWEDLKENDEGLLEGSVAEIIQRSKRKRQAEKKGNTKLGMMRHLFLLLDCSESMSNRDLKPTRLISALKLFEAFIGEFFDQNPISQLGIIALRNRRAEKVVDLAGNGRKHIKTVQALHNTNLVGEPSLKNGLDLALRSLKVLPSHASREILIVLGSLTTCDPGDITTTIDMLKSEGVRCSVIGLAADVFVCRQLTAETGGLYGVILDDCHFRDQLFQHVDPPPAVNCLESSLIKMGFPHQLTVERKEEPLTMCMCHLDSVDEPSKLTTGGYYCPQCCSKYCELPVECRACGLTLVSAPHLARSYHHLFPVEAFKEIPYEKQVEICYACQKPFSDTDKHVYVCGVCSRMFCIDCDIFIHETLHTCPGCATNQKTFQQISNDVTNSVSNSG